MVLFRNKEERKEFGSVTSWYSMSLSEHNLSRHMNPTLSILIKKSFGRIMPHYLPRGQGEVCKKSLISLE